MIQHKHIAGDDRYAVVRATNGRHVVYKVMRFVPEEGRDRTITASTDRGTALRAMWGLRQNHPTTTR